MSHLTPAISNTNSILGISSILNGTSNTISTHTNKTIFSNYAIVPSFKMEMYKSENGGFVMNLITYDPNTFTERGKLFTLNDIDNLGRDIQNILIMEILKG